jgi:dCMP deaminase
MNSNRPDWNTYFMRLADIIKQRSPDPARQVGCVLVDKHRRIVSTGYNGLKAGIDETTVDWLDRENLYKYIIHAETNCLLYSRNTFDNSVLYTTLSPCKECIKLLSASGITTIYYNECYRDFDQVVEIASFFGIQLIQQNK